MKYSVSQQSKLYKCLMLPKFLNTKPSISNFLNEYLLSGNLNTAEVTQWTCTTTTAT